MKDYYLKSQFLKTITLLLILFVLSVQKLSAEGSKELLPSSTDKGYLYINGANQAYGKFAHYSDDTARRLYINICNLGEKVFFGFRLLSNMDAFVRIKDPNGNIVFGPVQIRRNNQTAAPGRIENYAQAVAGPNTLVAGGYNPLSFVPLMTGNYRVEFNRNSATVNNTAITDIELFDFTVRDTINNITRKGRLWSRAWNLNQTNFGIEFRGTMFMYAPDGIVTNINFNEMEPYIFVISANGRGCVNTGNGNLDRQSRTGNFTYPEYPIFLNAPDTLCFPTGILGALTDSVRVTGCDPQNRCIEITVNKAGLIDIILDLNGIPGYQPGTSDVIISTQVDSGYNCIPWNSLDGLGNIVIQDQSFPVLVDYFNGLTHLPLYDVENHRLGFIVNITAPPGPKPRMFWDDTQLPSGTAELFIGCTLPAGCHNFPFNTAKTSSTGFGDVRTINSWWFASVLRDSTSIPGSIIYVTTNTNNPPYNRNDTTICSNAGSVQLFGGVFGSTQNGQWSSLSASPGSFSPSDTVLGATYTPSLAERNAGIIRLLLVSTNNGSCPPRTDTLTVNIAPGPQAIAPPGDTVCYNNPTINLTGSFSQGVSAYWSGGGGTFAPDSLNLSVFYVPTQAEIDSGRALLVLNVTGNPPCGVITTDTTIVTIIDPLVVIAGASGQVCKNNPAYQLNGTVIGASGGRWTGGNGTYSPNDSTLNAVYTPTAAEINSGQVVLRLQSIGNGRCNSEQDTIIINFIDPPAVDGGGNQAVCDFFTTVDLTGIVTPGGFSASWSGSNGTFSPSPDSLNTTYNITPADTAAGQVMLFLTTASANGCLPVADTVIITLLPTPRAIINNPKFDFVCKNNPTLQLSGTTTLGAGFNWIGGGGTFNPGNTVANPTYTLSQLELDLFFTSIILQSTGVACAPTSDTIGVFVLNPQEPNAGPDDTVCTNNPIVQLNGSFDFGTTTLWSGGTGSFSNNTIVNPTYTPTAGELATGFVNLYFTVNDALCSPVTDTVRITFRTPPIVDAGADQEVCRNNDKANLNGSVSGATGGIWTGNGGTFQPNDTSLNGSYFSSQTEKNNNSTFVILTSTGNGNCLPVSDTMTISFSPNVTVNAGPDLTVCKANPAVTLNGVITNVPGNPGSWLGGGGNFSPNRNQMNVTYTPTVAEINNGFVDLILRSKETSSCDHQYDTVRILYLDNPSANAGPPLSVCRDNPTVTLNGSVSIATGGTWSGGNGNFSNVNSLTSTYTATAAEVNNGFVTLTLTTTGNFGCIPGNDTMTITFSPTVTVDAGPDISICTGVPNVSLNGSVTVAGGGRWSTGGSGTFSPNDSTLTATYAPSNADRLAGSVILTLTTIQNGTCNPKSNTLTITFLPNPTIDAGPNQTVCTNDYPIQLNATGSAGAWEGGSNANFVPNRNALNATYTPTPAELAAGTLILRYATAASANCIVVTDSVILTLLPGPLANAGGPIDVCADNDSIQLAGGVIHALGGVWSTTGTGLFSPNPNLLNAKYTPSNSDKNAGIVRLVLTVPPGGGCSSVNDTLVINIAPFVTVEAGPNQSVCSDVTSVNLNGQVTTATGGQWTSLGGGSFNPSNTSLTAVYIPTATEKSNELAILYLTSTGNGLCQPVVDTVKFTFTSPPTVVVSNDTSVCASTNAIPVSGSITVASGGIWTSSGNGLFSPSDAILSTNYVFDSVDKQNGQVIIRLTTSGNGDCNARTDSLVVTLEPEPIVNPGPDLFVCSDIDSIILNGSVQHATGGKWISSGSGTFFPDANTLNTRYIPSAFDKLGGFVTLTLISTGNGLCDSTFKRLDVFFTPAPTVFAGLDLQVCLTNDTVNLTGNSTNASGLLWSSSGTGTFTSLNNASSKYIPSASDKTNGSVKLFLTAIGNGSCQSAIDSITVDILAAPNVSAGPDRTICADSIGIVLNALLTNALNVQWISSGTGGFFPKSDTINNTYVPSANDRLAPGIVNIFVTSTGNGPCPAAKDTLVLTILPVPTVNPGVNQTVCADTSNIPLNGSVTNATGGYWVASGTGVFTPDSSFLNASYVPSANDIAAGNVRLSLYTSGTGLCRQVNNFIDVTITPAPTLELGPDLNICIDHPSVALHATSTIANGIRWTTSGSGIFLPDSLTNSTNYFPSLADRASGLISLFGITTENGLCRAVSDTMTLTISPLPTIDAGPDRNVCISSPGVPLTGSSSNSLGAIWTANASGTFSPNNTSANATFTPATGVTTGKIFYSNVGSGVCAPKTDSMIFNVIPIATVDAGPDLSICNSFPEFRIEGSHTNADSVRWTTTGTGQFDPRNRDTTDYNFSNNDLLQNFFTVTLTAYTNGVCPNVSDMAIINVVKKPTVSVGGDFEVCASLDSIALFASTTNSTGGDWTSSGTGIFLPSPNQTQVWYIPTAADTTAGSLTFFYEVTGALQCANEVDDVIVNFVSALSVDAGGPLDTVCTNSLPIHLNGSGTSGTWSGGAGNFNPSQNVLNAIYTPTAGEIAAGSVKLHLTSPATGACASVVDSVIFIIPSGPIANAGPNITVCADTSGVPLSGSISNASQSYWKSSGSGSFSPDSSFLNAIYIPSVADLTDSAITLTLFTLNSVPCIEAQSQKTLFINPAPSVFAGLDHQVCRDIDTILLTATFQRAAGVRWTSTGTGTFVPNDSATVVKYIPSATDRDSLNLRFIASTFGNGLCKVVKDTVIISLTPSVTLDLGNNFSVCSDELSINLSSTFTVASGIQWSTVSPASGALSPNANTNNPVYTLSNADRTLDSLIFRATTLLNGSCLPSIDSVVVFIQQPPTADAGADFDVCINTNLIQLNGIVTGATGGAWATSGTGTFSPNDSTINAIYNVSAADKIAGAVNLSLTTTGTGACAPVNDFTSVFIFNLPTAIVNAGLDQFLCRDVNTVNLFGLILNAQGGIWSTSGSGIFIPNIFSLNAIYVPTVADKNNGFVDIYLTSIGTGVCDIVTDTMTTFFTPPPTVDAGADTVYCVDVQSIPLSAAITVANGGIWSSSGTGSFAPSNGLLNTNYIPSTTDRSLTNLSFTITTDGNGTCLPRTDTKIVTFLPKPIVNPGSNRTICSNVDSIQLNASVINATGGIWTSSGAGTFVPNNTALNAIYVSTFAERASGTTVLVLTSTGNGSCNPKDTAIIINYLELPELDAGIDQLVCNSLDTINLNGSINTSQNIIWQSTGSGSFVPNAFITNPAYIRSGNDTATIVFTIKTTNGICVNVTDQKLVSFQPNPQITIGPQNACLDSGFVQLLSTISNGTIGSWSTAGNGSFSPNVFVGSPLYYPSTSDLDIGRIDLTLTTLAGVCPADSGTISISLFQLPFVDAGLDRVVCRGSSVSLSGLTNSLGAHSEWITLTGGVISNSANANIIANSDTSFVYVVTDLLGCRNIDTISIFVIDPPTLNLPVHLCFYDTVILNASPQNLPPGGGFFQWYKGDTVLPGKNDTILQANNAGLYVVIYNFGSCFVEDSSNVTAPPNPSLPDRIVCNGSLDTLIAINIPNSNYDWSEDGIPLFQNVSSLIYQANNSPVTDQVFSLILTDSLGCIGYDTIRVRTTEIPILNLNDTALCQGSFVILNGAPINIQDSSISVYTWFRNNILLTSEVNSQLTVLTTGTYSLIYSLGKCSSSDTSAVQVNPNPIVVLRDTYLFCPDEQASLAIDAGITNQKYLWLGPGLDSDDTLQIVNVVLPGQYNVLVTNQFNCRASDSTIVIELCDPKVFNPTGFTPGLNNGDNPNSVYRVFGKYFTDFSLTIFNRWGEVIFYAEDINEGWDGTYKGEPMPEGTYPVIIKYKGQREGAQGPFKIQSSVTLIR